MERSSERLADMRSARTESPTDQTKAAAQIGTWHRYHQHIPE